MYSLIELIILLVVHSYIISYFQTLRKCLAYLVFQKFLFNIFFKSKDFIFRS